MDAVSDGRDPARTARGAYLLGALDPADRAEFETHLAGCPACREELADLAGLPGLLGRLTAEDAVGLTPVTDVSTAPDPAVLDRALVGVTRHRRRQRRRWLVGAAAAVLIAAGGAAAGVAATIGAGRPDDIPTPAAAGRIIAATDPATHVHARVTLRADPAGTALTISLTGVRPGAHCQLIAVSAEGRREVASSWRADYGGHADVTGATAIPAAQLASLQVLTADHSRLVTLPVHR